MQLRLFARVLPGIATASVISALAVTTTSNYPSYATGNKFFCTEENGIPVTKIRTSRGNQTFIRWVVKDFKKFPPKQRCKIVTAKFQRYYDNGSLYITSRDNFNSYPVLCIANRKGASCEKENVLVTLKPGTDTGRVLQQMVNFRRSAGESVIDLSGCQAFSYEEGEVYLDVKQLVDGEGCVQ
ncbi:MAG: COP23 domain-containing protein [Nostoc sp. ZfuVER08]|nr:COP23 domain-containing protein [Nostoc sp. ZfuVER08]